MAVALRLRRTGARLGDQLMERTLDEIAGAADVVGADTVMVWGLIHHENAASQALADRMGFFCISDNSAGLQEWWLRIDIDRS